MKIIKHEGSILNVKSGIIIHGCNAKGVMGAGVAKAIRDRYELVYTEYRRAYTKNKLHMGSLHATQVSNSLCVISAITQKDYGRDHGYRYVSYDAIFEAFEQLFLTWPDVNVHFPKIGCGLAGGEWDIVRPMIKYLAKSREFKGSLNLWEL